MKKQRLGHSRGAVCIRVISKQCMRRPLNTRHGLISQNIAMLEAVSTLQVLIFQQNAERSTLYTE
ncbi:hypothetical protein A8709_21685 [Paenibacillus pectinilyticus]|uniref:Uncharacterized protein n=1 Tax=Paenibacillus pectinilyticus TaxID=512399 RepID=A0A1C0ZXY6_9BACL|nr:hypothetical protein [Paenibacillus pectinilyticus]OCT12939.1 hypothetical protein A8709_21685 [Paenibacillus pectinilyticus]